MTEKELMRILQSDDSDKQYDTAKEELAKELQKPLPSQDLDRVDALIQTIEHINGEEYASKDITEQGIASLNQRIARERRKQIRIFKWAAACACAFILVSNIWSYKAYGMNAFSAAYQMLNGGINVDLNSRDASEVYIGNPFADEMKRICAENSMDVQIPMYIPEGFQATELFGDINCSPEKKQLLFYFRKSNKRLNIAITCYSDTIEPPAMGIPTEHYEISEQVIQNIPITVMKEDEQYTAAFAIERTQYIIYADHLDYDECQRILDSFFE